LIRKGFMVQTPDNNPRPKLRHIRHLLSAALATAVATVACTPSADSLQRFIAKPSSDGSPDGRPRITYSAEGCQQQVELPDDVLQMFKGTELSIPPWILTIPPGIPLSSVQTEMSLSLFPPYGENTWLWGHISWQDEVLLSEEDRRAEADVVAACVLANLGQYDEAPKATYKEYFAGISNIFTIQLPEALAEKARVATALARWRMAITLVTALLLTAYRRRKSNDMENLELSHHLLSGIRLLAETGITVFSLLGMGIILTTEALAENERNSQSGGRRS